MNKYKILFVDDETIYLRYLQKVLDWEALGFEVCGCLTDGVQVVEQAGKDRKTRNGIQD